MNNNNLNDILNYKCNSLKKIIKNRNTYFSVVKYDNNRKKHVEHKAYNNILNTTQYFKNIKYYAQKRALKNQYVTL